MYCPKCNLHSEEYVDRCPLCDGPMEVDEVASGIMKTPPIPEDSGAEEFPIEDALRLEQDLKRRETGAAPDDELGDGGADEIEPSEGVKDLDEERGGEPTFERVRGQSEPELPTTPPEVPVDQEPSGGGNKSPSVGILIVLILVLVGAGYYFYALVPKTDKSAGKEATLVKKPLATESKMEVDEPGPGESNEADTGAAALTGGPVDEPSWPESVEETEALKKEEEPSSATTMDVGHLAKSDVSAEPPGERLEPSEAELESEPSEPILSGATPAEMALADARRVLEPPKAIPGGIYSLHVGSFRKEERADAFRDQLIRDGYPAYSKLVNLPDKGDWYRVLVGRYATREEAELIAEKLQAEENVSALLMRK